jgi:hypothetical protein
LNRNPIRLFYLPGEFSGNGLSGKLLRFCCLRSMPGSTGVSADDKIASATCQTANAGLGEGFTAGPEFPYILTAGSGRPRKNDCLPHRLVFHVESVGHEVPT